MGVTLLPFLAVALSRLPDGPGYDADDHGQYLMRARALAEGRPYADIGAPSEWDVIESSGRWLGTVSVPTGAAPLDGRAVPRPVEGREWSSAR